MPDDYAEYDAQMEKDLQKLLQGKRGSPDLPSRNAVRAYQNYPTDQVIQDFMDRFGQERAMYPKGPPPSYVPMPRPRDPYSQPGPMGPEPVDVPLAGGRVSDVQSAVRGEGTLPEEAYGRPVPGDRGADPYDPQEDQGPSDERLLGMVQQGMKVNPAQENDVQGVNMEEDLQSLESNPTPENEQAFIDHWGRKNLPEDWSVDDNAH